MSLDLNFYLYSSPILILCIGSIFLMIQSTVIRFNRPDWSFFSLVFFLVSSFFCSLFFGQTDQSFLNDTFVSDYIGNLASQSILLIGILFAVMTYEMSIREKFFRADILSVFLMTILGMMVFVSSFDWITMFVGLEMTSLGLYVLVCTVYPCRKSLEAAIKYFILGSVASSFLLFGIAFLYASTESLLIPKIVSEASEKSLYAWVEIGCLFMFSGLLFKLAISPFHFWAPDVYEASLTPLTGFMATAVKVMMFSVLVRLVDLISEVDLLNRFVLVSSLISIGVGNMMGLSQISIKRLLAYSSIAHSGYMMLLMSFCHSDHLMGLESLAFYLMTYVITSVCFFAILMWLESQTHQNLSIDDLTGLSKQYPFAAFALTVCLLSFSGLPPALGFFGKFFVFLSVLESGMYLPAIIAALLSIIGLYYYLRIIVKMYMYPRDEHALPIAPVKAPFSLSIVSVALCFLIVFSLFVPRMFFSS